MKIEFIKPVFHIDKFFKVADHLLSSDNYELVEVGRAMRKAYENQMVETEEREAEEELSSDLPEDRMKQWQKGEHLRNPEECKSGVCD